MGAAAGMGKRKVGFVGVGLILTPLLLAATGCGYIESRKQSIAEGSNQRGLEWAQTGEYDKAIWEFGEALKIRPDFADAFNNLGSVLLIQGEADKALWNFDQALKSRPDFVAAEQASEEARTLKAGAATPASVTRP